ncbi:hypothetical protein [Yinghuangia seranimata]|nr:hypothetical protein [Yinghuangia seranimata]MDI2129011.1 hypothetical protein [Yinghuangia seranimata]
MLMTNGAAPRRVSQGAPDVMTDRLRRQAVMVWVPKSHPHR